MGVVEGVGVVDGLEIAASSVCQLPNFFPVTELITITDFSSVIQLIPTTGLIFRDSPFLTTKVTPTRELKPMIGSTP